MRATGPASPPAPEQAEQLAHGALALAGRNVLPDAAEQDGVEGEPAPVGGGQGGKLVLDPGAHSDDFSHRFRSKPATCSDRSQPGIPMIPAG